MRILQSNRILIALAGLGCALHAGAEDRIMFVTGGVQIRNAAGELRPAFKGVEVRPGETIVTAPGGYAQAKMEAGFMAVRPDTQVRLDTPLPSLNQAATIANQVTLQQGSVRMIAAKQESTPAGQGVAPPPRALPEIVIITPNANISLSNSDGEAVILPPKVAGAVPTTISMVNSGTALVKGDVGAAVPVASNMAATVSGKTLLPDVTPIVSLPTLPAALPAIAPVAVPPPDVSLAKAGPGMTSPTVPSVGVTAPPPVALATPTLPTAPTLATGKLATPSGIAPTVALQPPVAAPAITPVIAPAPVVAPPAVVVPPVATAPVIAPLPVMAPPPTVIKPVAPVVTPPVVITPPTIIKPVVPPPVVIAPPPVVPLPTTIIKPTLTCTKVLINGVFQQICK